MASVDYVEKYQHLFQQIEEILAKIPEKEVYRRAYWAHVYNRFWKTCDERSV